jgi:hypothetical protein
MYISKTHQIAYFATPRCGSNTVHEVIENSGLVSDSDIAFKLSGLDAMINMSEQVMDPNSQFTTMLNNYHMTPSEAIYAGHVTADELLSFTSFSFVRDPLKRWVSRVFLANGIGLWNHENPADYLTQFVRSRVTHNPTATTFSWKMKDYFYHEGTQVVTPHRFENIDTVLPNIINSFEGFCPAVLPKVQPIRETPAEYKNVYDWLPQDCIDILTDMMAEDIEFYNSITE